jgi:hypothetical protein
MNLCVLLKSTYSTVLLFSISSKITRLYILPIIDVLISPHETIWMLKGLFIFTENIFALAQCRCISYLEERNLIWCSI